jgi:hypothetical protein
VLLPKCQCQSFLLVSTVDAETISVPGAPHETSLPRWLCQGCVGAVAPTATVSSERTVWRIPVYIELDMFVRIDNASVMWGTSLITICNYIFHLLFLSLTVNYYHMKNEVKFAPFASWAKRPHLLGIESRLNTILTSYKHLSQNSWLAGGTGPSLTTILRD